MRQSPPIKEELRRWADQLKKGTISMQDRERFEAWLHAHPDTEMEWTGEEDRQLLRDQLLANIQDRINAGKRIKPLEVARVNAVSLPEENLPKTGTVRRLTLRLAAAAGIVAALSIGLYQYYLPLRSHQETAIAQDALPGHAGAILTLANGRQLVLDSLAPGNGALLDINSGDLMQAATADKKSLVKLTGEQLVYAEADADVAAGMNTLSTPKGRVFRLTLPDGSAVWLNASSSITYPVKFAKDRRLVTVSGEAYFEVTKDKKRPFIARTSGVDVEVLGTHFNVNAYADEDAVKTTLLEGKVRLVHGEKRLLLAPGQQSRTTADKTTIVQADEEEVMAWKDGFFQFNQATGVDEVLRQLARWYDMQIVYAGAIPEKQFVGEIPRDTKLSEVLKVLEKTGVEFKIENKKIIVQGGK